MLFLAIYVVCYFPQPTVLLNWRTAGKKILMFVSKQQSVTLGPFFRLSVVLLSKKKCDEVSLLAVFDVQLYSTKGFSTKSCTPCFITSAPVVSRTRHVLTKKKKNLGHIL